MTQPTGRGRGNRAIPWEEIERIYVQGELPSVATKNTERVWPSLTDLAHRFRVTPRTMRDHATRHQWTHKRDAWKRDLIAEVSAQSQRYVQSAAEVLGDVGARIVKNIGKALDEIDHAFEYWKTAPPPPPKGLVGLIKSAVVPEGDAEVPATPKRPRPPMPGRDLAYYMSAQKAAYDTLRAIYGVSPSQASPGSGGHNQYTESPMTSAPVPAEPVIPAEVMFAVVDTIAERNKAPKKDGG